MVTAEGAGLRRVGRLRDDVRTLLADEEQLIAGKRGATRLGFSLLLKFYARAGRFPRGNIFSGPTGVALRAYLLGRPSTGKRQQLTERALPPRVGAPSGMHRSAQRRSMTTGIPSIKGRRGKRIWLTCADAGRPGLAPCYWPGRVAAGVPLGPPVMAPDS